MIVSHARRFIFIKTVKTAGTALEIVLSKYCADGDIITPLIPEEEEIRTRIGGKPAQNYQKPMRRLRPAQKAKVILGGARPPQYIEHEPAWRAKESLGPEIWNTYLKFCVVRDPFDRFISRFYFTKKWREQKARYENWDMTSPDQFARYQAEFINENWALYTEKDRVIVDEVLRYEALEAGLAAISKRIGLSHNLYDEMRLLRVKADYRPSQSLKASQLGDEQKKIVQLLCRKEIEMFYQ